MCRCQASRRRVRGAEAVLRLSETAAEGVAPSGPCRFVLYVEGPRDRDVLRHWGQRLSPDLARSVERCSVILGGRRPARAVEHFRELQTTTDPVRGVCVLDRDDGLTPRDPHPEEPGLEFYIWRRRHIESYLLVPDAIRRSLRLPQGDPRIAPLFGEHLPPDGDAAWLELNAKRLLASRGPLAEGLGRPLDPGLIARAMRVAELHRDVLDLFSLVRTGLALVEPERRIRSRA